jgi:type II secretory pathway component GspD/PulD (secretin)
MAKRTAPPSVAHPKKDGKHVYTLRVKEKPVGAVIRELSKRLQWPVVIDEEGIRKAGKSLDTRVSFSVENADRDQLLEALLKPAGLEFRVDGDRVRIVAERDAGK